MSDRDALAEDTLTRYALPLVRKVQEEEPAAWGAWLESIPADRVRVMCVLLAALVPVDATVAELTAWMRTGRRRLTDTAVEGPGGELIDLVAVQRALTDPGRVELTETERRVAVRIGTEAGLSAAEIARRVGRSQRWVTRARSEAVA